MIPAASALRLPQAQLSDEEKRAADVLEQAIENHIQAHMTRAGCEVPFEPSERRSPVIAEVSQRLKRAGWVPQWQARPGPFGLVIVLAAVGPSDEAYRLAADIFASA